MQSNVTMCGDKKHRTDVMPCQSLHTRLSEIGTLAWFCGQPGRDPGGRHSQDRGTGSPQRADRSEIVSDWKQWIWTVDGQLMVSCLLYCHGSIYSTSTNLFQRKLAESRLFASRVGSYSEPMPLKEAGWRMFTSSARTDQISVSLSSFSEGKNVTMTSLKALLVWIFFLLIQRPATPCPLQFLLDHWYFIASAGMWLHRAAVGHFLQDRPAREGLIFLMLG